MAGIALPHVPHLRHLGRHPELDTPRVAPEERPPVYAVALMFVVVALLATALTAICIAAGDLAT